ncbi:MAG: molybdopterin molybdotransferase MoeA [Myxococcales bacterium]
MADPTSLLPVEAALAEILRGVRPLAPEPCPLDDLPGRALAEDLRADRPLPPFDSSAMDGWAVRAADAAVVPVSLAVAFEVPAGGGAPRPLERGQAARIFTGSPIPPGADAVVMQEEARASHGQVEILRAPQLGEHLRPAGEDVEAGQIALAAGTTFGAAEVALTAALGRVRLQVHRRPRAAIVTTGDELHNPGMPLPPSRIYDSNGPALAAAVRAAGGEPIAVLRAPDEPEAIRGTLQRCDGADVIFTVAGVSVGDRDHVRAVLEGMGARLALWRVAMRPGKPVAFGRLGERPVLCLPGNPVSALVTFELFGRPLLRRLGGHAGEGRFFVEAPLAREVHKPPQLALFCRGRFDGQLFTPAPKQGSGLLTSIAGQDALAELPVGPDRVAAGARVRVRLLDRPSPGVPTG